MHNMCACNVHMYVCICAYTCHMYIHVICVYMCVYMQVFTTAPRPIANLKMAKHDSMHSTTHHLPHIFDTE